tara:strand:- start:1943 stop:3175 length:1233 start_codon:yes stop_codon:yes gene_type:complete
MKKELIRFDHVSKKFCRNLKSSMIYTFVDAVSSFFNIYGFAGRLRKNEFYAIKDVSFSLVEGERLGILGANGSGKSTLLRLITGIYLPSSGEISVKGRVGALIAVGAGFHQHMTGRENIFLNGVILGMSRSEVQERFQEIVDFSELEEFLDAPVSTYSSGMRVKLGFSIAVHSRCEILLVDEVLSVGDLAFREKCLKKMTNLQRTAKSLVFISHNIEQVQSLCSRVMVMDEGQVVYSGDTEEAISFYQNLMYHKAKKQGAKEALLNEAYEILELDSVKIFNANKEEVSELKVGETITCQFTVTLREKIDNLLISVALRDAKGNNVIWQQNTSEGMVIKELEPGRFIFNVSFKEPKLAPNNYNLVLGFANSKNLERYGKYVSFPGTGFVVRGQSVSRGIVNCESSWTFSRG